MLFARRTSASRLAAAGCAVALVAVLVPATSVHAKPGRSAKPSKVAVSTKEVGEGKKVTLTGKAAPRAKVKVQARLTTTEYAVPKGGNVHDEVKHRWRTVKTVRANKKGRWKLKHKPSAPLAYRARTSGGKSKATPVAVWHWSDLKHRSRGGILKTQSGGLNLVDTVVGGTAHLEAIRLRTYEAPSSESGTWDLGGTCTTLRFGAAIPDAETTRQGNTARVQVLVDGRPAIVSSAGYGRTTPVVADVTDAPTVTVKVDDPTAVVGTYEHLVYDTVLVDAQVLCKD